MNTGKHEQHEQHGRPQSGPTAATLVLPPRLTDSARSLRDTAQVRGLHTVQLPSFTVPSGLRAQHLHAGPDFADAVAGRLGIALLEAPADWLATLPAEFTRREVRAMPLREAYALRRPAFVKSPNDKGITARVYADGSRLPGPDAADPATLVLVSDVVTFTSEFRLFLLDGHVHAASRYARQGRLDLGPVSTDASAFAADLLAACGHTLPSAIVIDIGTVADRTWAVIEANAAWASGRYTADPDPVLDVVLRAAAPLTRLTEPDRPFLRPPRVPTHRLTGPGG
jgi:ATP-grasp domain, R2K clade family 2